MKALWVVTIALVLAGTAPARAAEPEPSANGCASTIDFRLVGSWIAEDGSERKIFLPESRSQTAEGRAVSTETCMAGSEDVEEVASVEIAPHLRSVTESHYHIGFIGLDRLLVTFPNGAVRFFRRLASGPVHVIDAVTHRNRS